MTTQGYQGCVVVTDDTLLLVCEEHSHTDKEAALAHASRLWHLIHLAVSMLLANGERR